jgi:RecA-family ATPase
MPILHRDFESRSTLDLSEVGVHVYAQHPTTELWCCAYAIDDEPVKLWVPGDPVPQEFVEAANNPDWIVCAHNDSFERTIEQHILAPRYSWPLVPIERHRCTMAAAQALSLPARLKTVATVLQLKHQKADDKLMRKMARPRKPRAGEDPASVYWHDDPEDIKKLHAYCRQDVEVERELHHRLVPLMPEEQVLWQLDARINDRGFHVDGKLLDAAIHVSEKVQDEIVAELVQLTGGAVGSVNEVAKLIAWLAANDCEVTGADKTTLKRALTRKGLSPPVRRVIELRLEGAKAAANKLHTMRAWRNGDGRIRGAFRFHGASTGRWSSHGVQVQNMKRPEVDDIDAAIEAVSRGDLEQLRQQYQQPLSVVGDITRALVCAKPGHKLIAADFSGIESRVTAWLSGQQSKLDQWAKFDRTRDPQDEPYFILGQQFGLAMEQARTIGKTADLAFGYQGGVGAWQKLAPADDATSKEQIKQYQQRWHAAHPNTKKFWYDLNSAAVRATLYANTQLKRGRVSFEKDGTFLFMTLPSGRRLSYPFPRTQRNDRKDLVVVFKDNSLGKWVDCRYGQGMYGGVWIENAVQAVARDLFAAAMPRLEAAGFPVVMHVHDEIVCEVPDTFGTDEEQEFLRLMLTLPAWAEGLPLGAKVRVSARFCKSKTAPQVDVSQDTEARAGADFRMSDAPAGSASETKDKECMKDKPANGGDNTYTKSKKQAGATHEATFTFRDAGGRDYQRELKHRNPDGTKYVPQEYFDGRRWVKEKPKGWVELPYRLPELIAAAPNVEVQITEGPKDADTLAALGFVSTTNANGAGKFTAEHAKWFTGKQRVCVHEDNDDAGRKHTAAVVQALTGIIPDIRVLRLPGLGDGEDVTDWLGKGHTEEELLEQIKTAPAATPVICWVDMSRWDGEPMPLRRWAISERVPANQVGIFSGEGGTGKSIIELMKNVAHVAQIEWYGAMPEQGPAFYLGAEDEEDEIRRRLGAIAEHHGLTFKQLIDGGLHVLCLLGKDATLCFSNNRKSGKVETTDLYRQIYEAAGDIKPKNISIDTLTRAFAGSEIDRVQVHNFAMHMQALAMVTDGGSVTVLSHPSLQGISSGTGLSGSTAWHNAFRFRQYLRGVKPESGEQPDNDLRELAFMKNQYGRLEDTMTLRYQHGLFLPEEGMIFDQAVRAAKAEEVFVELLLRFAKENRHVSDKRSAIYAPVLFAREDAARKAAITKDDLEKAMRRLFAAGKIWNEPHGKPSRPSYRLAVKS